MYKYKLVNILDKDRLLIYNVYEFSFMQSLFDFLLVVITCGFGIYFIISPELENRFFGHKYLCTVKGYTKGNIAGYIERKFN